MKVHYALAAAIALIASPAIAEEPSLTVGQCLELNAGFSALDGYDAVVKEGAQEKTVKKQYRLGAMRGPIGLNMAKLRAVVEGADKARTALVTEVTGGAPVVPGSPELAKLTAEYQKILGQPCDAKLRRMKLSDLNLGDGPDQNAIPPSVISTLSPLLDE